MHSSESEIDLADGLKDVSRASDSPPRILAIVVVYKMQPNSCPSLQTLVEAAEYAGSASIDASISVADNTPGGQSVDPLASGAAYRAFPNNPGLAPIYNLAIAEAASNGIPWLLTLDQDTHLPAEFLKSMAEWIARYQDDDRVAAIVPRIFDGARPVSPLRFIGGFLPLVVGPKLFGLLGEHATALNSASLLRISALQKVGGYDERFPLNNSDTALFHRLDQAGYRVVLAGDITVRHELAIMQRQDRMTIERYRQLLIDERDFWDLHLGALARAERMVRLAGRLLKAMLSGEGADFQQATLGELRHRLFTRKTVRIRNAKASSGDSADSRAE